MVRWQVVCRSLYLDILLSRKKCGPTDRQLNAVAGADLADDILVQSTPHRSRLEWCSTKDADS